MMTKWIQTRVFVIVGIAAGLVMIGCAGLEPGADSGTKDKEKKVEFVTEVKPLLEYFCLRCHNTGLLLGDLNLETRKLAFTPGDGGPFIIPEHPEASKFYQVLKLPKDNKEAMPPVKHRMTEEQRDIIYRWIKQGADWPTDRSGTLVPIVARPAVAMLGEVR